MKKTFLEDLKEGKVLYGLGSNYPASGIVEAMCVGWDFAWLDGQHGQHTYESIRSCMQATRAMDIYSVIRVPGNEEFLIGQYEDLVPSAIMIPMVSNIEEAKQIIKYAKFAPVGERSYGSRTAIDLYGREFFNIEIAVIAQIETSEGLNNVEDIASVDGIDVLFFGADDMKLSMGIPINTKLYESEELINVAKKIANVTKEKGKISGVVGGDDKTRKLLIELGYQVIVAGADSGFIRGASKNLIDSIKG